MAASKKDRSKPYIKLKQTYMLEAVERLDVPRLDWKCGCMHQNQMGLDKMLIPW